MSNIQYGIDAQKLQVIQANFEQGQYLTDVLQDHEVEVSLIDQVARKSEEVFDVRRMRAGKTYTILKDRENQRVNYFIYEINDAEFVVFDLRDSVDIYMDMHELSMRTRTISGVIKSSMYETFQAQGLDISLAKLMEEVFAWSVDFFHLEAGDFFKVIYEEQFVDEISIGISHIVSAQIQHEGEDFFAFYYAQDSLGEYYDANGQGLRGPFLKSPLSVQTWGEAASASEFPSRQSRLSIDFGAPQTTPVLAMGAGVVKDVRRRRGQLSSVSIRHEAGYLTQYMHLSEIATGLKVGQEIEQGNEIGLVGSPRGSSSHVRLRFWKNGRQIHPFEVEMPASSFISEEQQEAFERFSNTQLELLKQIPLETDLVSIRQEW
jgi:murein DD-endopeptidase MepM/ murein hydrolase activator NlpD